MKIPMYRYFIYENGNYVTSGSMNTVCELLHCTHGAIEGAYAMNRLMFGKYKIYKRKIKRGKLQ